jgi:hypothetical protein
MMKRLAFTVRPYQNAARPHLKWQVAGKIAGKRSRKFFKTRCEAKTYADLRNVELAQHGSQAMQLSTYDRLVAQRCMNELAPYNLTLQDATRAIIEREKARRQSCAIQSTCAEFVDARRKYSRHEFNAIRRLTERLCEVFGDSRLICEISTRDLEQFLDKIGTHWSNRSRNQYRNRLFRLWKYGDK